MYRRGRPASSAPCSLVGSTTKATVSGALPFSNAPSACDTLIAGIVTFGSVPPMPGGGLAGALLAMITPVAPAACAFAAFTAKPHEPRSTIAILPATSAALVNAEQPSVVEVPSASDASTPTIAVPAKLPGLTVAPKLAVPYG